MFLWFLVGFLHGLLGGLLDGLPSEPRHGLSNGLLDGIPDGLRYGLPGVFLLADLLLDVLMVLLMVFLIEFLMDCLADFFVGSLGSVDPRSDRSSGPRAPQSAVIGRPGCKLILFGSTRRPLMHDLAHSKRLESFVLWV